MKGSYLLLIELKDKETIQIGKLGKIDFMKGFYVYIGSAINGLEQRINRHLRKEKKLHWHIDFLLKSAGGNISSGKNLVCIEVSGNTSVIANMLMNMVKKHVLICYSKFKDAHANIYCNLSIRNKKDRNNLGTITARIAKEVKGNGGGHPKAAAAQLPQRNFLKFVKFLDNEI